MDGEVWMMVGNKWGHYSEGRSFGGAANADSPPLRSLCYVTDFCTCTHSRPPPALAHV